MKKLLGLFSVIILTLVLTACGASDEETTRTFKSEEDGMSSEITFTFKGDKVIKLSSENLIPYDMIGISSKEEAQEIFEFDSEEATGLTRESIFTDSEYIEKATVNLEEFDKNKSDELYEFFLVLDADNNIDFDKTEADLNEYGFKEEK